MARTVLVIHGAGEPRLRHGKVYWETLLGASLGPGYRVHAPRMPRPTEPHYQAWADRIQQLIAEDEGSALVGHSFGASVLLKYLSEAARLPTVAGVFLVATPFWGPDVQEFVLAPDFARRLHGLRNLYLYHSRDDAEVAVEHLERYRRALPQAVVRILDGRGHEFDQPEFPELVADIRSVMTKA